MKEIWKDIKGYEGHYQINKIGECKSLARTFLDTMGRKHIMVEKILRPFISKEGYSNFILSLNDKRSTHKAHRLVAQAFLDNPYDLPNVLHRIESMPSNDCVENLFWGTPQDNTADMIKKGRQAKGNKHPLFGKKGADVPNFGNKHRTKRLVEQTNAKSVLDTETGISYLGVKAAAAAKEISYHTLKNKLCGFRRNNTNLIYV